MELNEDSANSTEFRTEPTTTTTQPVTPVTTDNNVSRFFYQFPREYVALLGAFIMLLILVFMYYRNKRNDSDTESSRILPAQVLRPIQSMRRSFTNSFQLASISNRQRERLEDHPPSYDDVHKGEEEPPAYKDL